VSAAEPNPPSLELSQMVLPITDGAWLMIESREAPQHVGGLLVLEAPSDAPDAWLLHLWERLREARDFQPPFTYRLKRPYGRALVHSWVTDDRIDLDHHLRLSALPRPGRIRELFVAVSHLHSTLLDRHRPLWEIHLIDGVEGGRVALYAKFHHSLFDGVGALRVLQQMLSPDPDRRDMPAPWEIPSTVPPSGVAKPPSVLRDGSPPPEAPTMAPLRAVGTVARLLREQRADTRAGVEGAIMPFSAPRSALNVRITGSRRFAADGVSLNRIRAVADAAGTTVNDVALAMSGHALRTYLTDRGALPEKPLTAMVPVNIRTEEEGAAGNALSFLVVDLATDVADPVQRLDRIHASMAGGKRRLEGLSRTERIAYALALTSPYVLGPLLGIAGRGRPVANIVISNLTGPREVMYFDGARLQGLYPASLLQQGQALNITLSSYDDEVQFGLTAARGALPQSQRMLDHLSEAITELEAAVG
jgi:diacylglycerol O-acyltransferase / wax synthase